MVNKVLSLVQAAAAAAAAGPADSVKHDANDEPAVPTLSVPYLVVQNIRDRLANGACTLVLVAKHLPCTL